MAAEATIRKKIRIRFLSHFSLTQNIADIQETKFFYVTFLAETSTTQQGINNRIAACLIISSNAST